MPHCLIEFSEGISQQADPQDIVFAVHQAIEDSELFISQNIRTRARPYHYYHAGNYNQQSLAFIHVTLHVMSGYSDLQKEDLTIDIVEVLQLFQVKGVLISCEILEISEHNYTDYFI